MKMGGVSVLLPLSLSSSSSSRRTLASATTHPAHVSNSPPPAALAAIRSSGIVACLRAQSGKVAIEAARAALNGGISVLEIVMSVPGVLEVIRDLVVEFPSSTIGAGTVLTVGDARNVVKAGAKFIMSPGTVKDISVDLCGSGVLYIPGVMTPTEIIDAHNSGARIVKIYPVSVLGAARYISVLQKPFSHIPMVASQGIEIDAVEAYIDGGATAVVLSDAIFDKEAIKQRDFDKVCQLAHCAALQGRRAIDRRQRHLA